MSAVETAGLPRAHLRTLLLLLLAGGPCHGYELLEGLRALGMRKAEAAGVYRALRALELDELVASWWEPSQSGPARRTYQLNEAGRSALDAGMGELEALRDALGLVLARYRDLGAGR